MYIPLCWDPVILFSRLQTADVMLAVELYATQYAVKLVDTKAADHVLEAGSCCAFPLC